MKLNKKIKQNACYSRYLGGLSLVEEVGKTSLSFLCSLDSYPPHCKEI